MPLYLRRVARPPRMCRSALLRSSSTRTCRYSPGFTCGRRSVRSLCTVDLETPNFFAAARTVVRFSMMYAARSQARSSKLSRPHTTPLRGMKSPHVLWVMYMCAARWFMRNSSAWKDPVHLPNSSCNKPGFIRRAGNSAISLERRQYLISDHIVPVQRLRASRSCTRRGWPCLFIYSRAINPGSVKATTLLLRKSRTFPVSSTGAPISTRSPRARRPRPWSLPQIPSRQIPPALRTL